MKLNLADPIEKQMLKSYLERLKLEKEEPSLEFLQKLQLAHMRNIPFENLSIMIKENQKDQVISLSIEDLFEKMVDSPRGGFCYELNGLFGWLLMELGFDVKYRVARVVIDSDVLSIPGHLGHTCLIVKLSEQYLVDVGFGNSYQQPLPFDRESVNNFGSKRTFRILELSDPYIDLINGLIYKYAYQEKIQGEWSSQYEFTSTCVSLQDFVLSCRWTETSDDSGFTQRWIVTKATPNGRISLTNHNLTITENGNSEKIKLTENSFNQYLKQYFEIELDQSVTV